MDTLYSLFPNPADLLNLPHEDLAPILLKLALPHLQSAGFTKGVVSDISVGDLGKGYPFGTKQPVEAHLNSAWHWAERQGYIQPSPGYNGTIGWYVLTETGAALAIGENIDRVREAVEFPKALLHPAIRDKAWKAIVRSANPSAPRELLQAVRDAFLEVEVAVRDACGYHATDFGEPLMKKAFDENTGPLGDRDTSKPLKERRGLQTLFIGAMNSYRNPVSHRKPVLEIEEAKDQLLLASHLLRIIGARRQGPREPND